MESAVRNQPTEHQRRQEELTALLEQELRNRLIVAPDVKMPYVPVAESLPERSAKRAAKA